MICPRCLKENPAGIHTCQATPGWHRMEQENERLRAELAVEIEVVKDLTACAERLSAELAACRASVTAKEALLNGIRRDCATACEEVAYPINNARTAEFIAGCMACAATILGAARKGEGE